MKLFPNFLKSPLLKHGSLTGTFALVAASTNQMLTAPLWGLRENNPYLHDGRALTVDAASGITPAMPPRPRPVTATSPRTSNNRSWTFSTRF
jgi:hypothetical protein